MHINLKVQAKPELLVHACNCIEEMHFVKKIKI